MDKPEIPLRRRRTRAPQTAPATLTAVDPVSHGETAAPARVSKAKPAYLPQETTAEDAFRLTLVQCEGHVAANLPAVVDRHDMEGMHQLRVGLRRLRVALSAFGDEFRTPAIEMLRDRAKQISARLAPARDFDVFIGELFEPAASADGSADAFAVLRTRAHTARRRAWDEAVSCVASSDFTGFMTDLGKAIDHRSWRDGSSAQGLTVFEAPATTLAARMLDHRLRASKKRARRLEHLSDTARHDLRIALKKLRYTAEFFAPLYASPSVGCFIKRLSRMQDILGALQDVAVARTTLERLVEIDDAMSLVPHAALSFAAGTVYGWHLECAAHRWRNAVKRWKKFAKTEPFWNVRPLD